MSRVLSGLILLHILSLVLPYAAMGENASLCVVREARDCSCDSPHRSIITSDFKEAFARVVLDEPEDARIEFTWYAPDGTVAAHNVRTATYSKHLAAYAAWDGVKLTDALGWWRVEAYYEGGYLSKEFLLTDNRQVITVISGTKSAKLRTLRTIDPAGEFGRDVLTAALEDEDPDIRAAALTRMGGLASEWVVVNVREGLWDQAGRVRISALRAAGALPDWEREMVYISALGSEDREFRLVAVNGLQGYTDDEAVGALKRALDDRYQAVRLAALNGLMRVGAPGLSSRLVKLVSDGDHELAAVALKAVIALPAADSHKPEALREAAVSSHDDLARTAVDALLPDGGRDDIPAFMKHFKDGYNRRAILQAIAKIPGREAAQALADAYRMSGADETLRLIAVRGLAGRGNAGSAILGEAIQDRSVAVRLQVLKSARTMPGVQARFDIGSLALKDEAPAVRRAALIYLADMKTDEAYARVMDAIPDPAVREDAFAVIRQALDPSLASELSKKGFALEDAGLRSRIVDTLAAGPADADAILPYLNDKDEKVRLAAVAALEGMKGAKAAYGLYMAGRDRDATVRQRAGAALGEKETGELMGGIGLLMEKGFLDARQSRFIASAVSDRGTLEMLVDKLPAGNRELLAAALVPVINRGGDGAVPALVKGLKAEDSRLAAEVASRLADSSLPEAGDALEGAFVGRPVLRKGIMDSVAGTVHETRIIGLALSDEDRVIRLKAASMINDLPKDKARSPVRDALDDPDTAVRLEAARAAGGFGFMEELKEAADDDDAQVREAAADGLSFLHNTDSARVLARLCLDGEERVSQAAVSGLVLMKEVVPDRLLTGLVKNRTAKASVKAAVVKVLAGRPGRESAEAVSSLLADEDAGLADFAQESLISMGRVALPAVYGMLKSERARYRALEVIGALPDRGSEKKVLGVIGVLKGPELVKAVETLGAVGGPKSLGVLAGLYNDAGLRLRGSLIKAVTGLGLNGDEPELVGMLDKALNSSEEGIRFEAVWAVGEMRVVLLKPMLKGMRGSEPSALVRSEIDRSLGKL